MKTSNFLLCLLLLTPAAGMSQVTYHADVAPIIHNACMECHRSGEIGPMPFTNYEEVSAYGPFIEYVTLKTLQKRWMLKTLSRVMRALVTLVLMPSRTFLEVGFLERKRQCTQKA